MKVGRRQFIFCAAAAGSLAVSALGVRIWRESTVANIVHTRVPDARVSAADMELFEKEVMAHEHVLNRTLLVARGLPAPLRNLLPQAVRAQLDKVESRIAANFLMGTDSFILIGNPKPCPSSPTPILMAAAVRTRLPASTFHRQASALTHSDAAAWPCALGHGGPNERFRADLVRGEIAIDGGE